MRSNDAGLCGPGEGNGSVLGGHPGGTDTADPAAGAGMAHAESDRSGAGDAAYARTIDSLRAFLDQFAQASPDVVALAELSAALEQWSGRMEQFAVPEPQRVYGRRQELPGLGQVTVPQFFVDSENEHEVSGRVRFGQYFLGGNMAAHGGTIPLLFDDLLGRLAQTGRTTYRTAYLHTDYRSITPVGPELNARAWFVEETGRKRLLRGTLHHGDELCAEGEGLFVALRPGQP